MAKRENYRRYGAGGPKKVVKPQWVKELPKDDLKWTPEQDMAYYEWSSIYGRRGYSKKEWEAIHMERQRIKEKEFKELSYIDDYNGESILLVLKKKYSTWRFVLVCITDILLTGVGGCPSA